MADEFESKKDELEQLDEKPKRTRAASGKKRGRKKTIDTEQLTDDETKNGFYYLFKILGKLTRSTAVYDEAEFKDLAKAYVRLANRFKWLRILVLLMAPLATLGELLDKFEKLKKGMPERKKKQKAGPPIVDAEFKDVPQEA